MQERTRTEPSPAVAAAPVHGAGRHEVPAPTEAGWDAAAALQTLQAGAGPVGPGAAGADTATADGRLESPTRPRSARQEALLRASLRRVQRGAGNAAAVQLLRSADRARPAEAPSPVVQREVKSKEGILDGVYIKTYKDAAGFLRSHVADLEQERTKCFEDGAIVPPGLFNVAYEGKGLLSNVSGAHEPGKDEIDEVTYDQVDEWYGKWGPAMDLGEVARTMKAAQKVHEIKIKTADAKAKMAQWADKVADAKAAAFKAEDETLLGAIWNWGTALVDSALDATPLLEAATDMERDLLTAAKAAAAQAGPNASKAGHTYKIPEEGKILPMVNLANNAVNAFQAVQGAADLVSSKKSASAKAKSDIKATVQIAGSLEGFLGVATGVGIMINLYITPMTDACLTALEGLEDVARKINRTLMENGLYDKVNWDLEPGKPNGRALFMFMLAVRNASDPSGVPQPVPAAVADFFVDNQEDLEAGSGVKNEKDEIPTTGAWFWKDVDQAKIAKWVFAHRADLWAMFYGSLAPNSNG
jgi:hypothetical protein